MLIYILLIFCLCYIINDHPIALDSEVGNNDIISVFETVHATPHFQLECLKIASNNIINKKKKYSNLEVVKIYKLLHGISTSYVIIKSQVRYKAKKEKKRKVGVDSCISTAFF